MSLYITNKLSKDSKRRRVKIPVCEAKFCLINRMVVHDENMFVNSGKGPVKTFSCTPKGIAITCWVPPLLFILQVASFRTGWRRTWSL